MSSCLASRVSRYMGVNIVEGVVQSNKEKYGSNSVDFKCLDIVIDELPDGELCLVKQVLQHLNNAEIQQVLGKLKKYKKKTKIRSLFVRSPI